jgi:hypothetical protein
MQSCYYIMFMGATVHFELFSHQVGEHVIVMAHVLGLLWMRNPLRMLFAEEKKGAVPAMTIVAGRSQPPSRKKGAHRHHARPKMECKRISASMRLQYPGCVWYPLLCLCFVIEVLCKDAGLLDVVAQRVLYLPCTTTLVRP